DFPRALRSAAGAALPGGIAAARARRPYPRAYVSSRDRRWLDAGSVRSGAVSCLHSTGARDARAVAGGAVEPECVGRRRAGLLAVGGTRAAAGFLEIASLRTPAALVRAGRDGHKCGTTGAYGHVSPRGSCDGDPGTRAQSWGDAFQHFARGLPGGLRALDGL